jgi:hypothetical protein
MRTVLTATLAGIVLGLAATPAPGTPLVVADGSSGRASATVVSAAAVPAVVRLPKIYACGAVLSRPATFPLWCWRTTVRAERLRWTSWNAARATAVGRHAFRTGQIVDGKHVWASYPARYVLDRPRKAKGRVVWTRVTRTYTGAVPQYDRRTKTIWLSFRSSGGTCALTWTEDKSEQLCGPF